MPNYASGGADAILIGQDLKKSMQMILEALAEDEKQLDYLLNGHISTMNVSELNAEVIMAETITTEKLAAGSVTADKITVNQLSAIAADLGHITAGLVEAIEMISSTITGSEIMTKPVGQYPRTEMSSSANLLSAEQSAGYSIDISPGGLLPNPAIDFLIGGLIRSSITLNTSPDTLSITTNGSTNISMQSGGSLNLSSSGPLKIDGINGYTGTFNVITSVDFVTGTYTRMSITVTKGIITGIS